VQPQAQSAALEEGPVVKRNATKSKLKPPVFDSKDIHLDVAVKETRPKEVILPGVMRLEGESLNALDPNRARRIQMNNGGTQTVYVSSTEINRIQLPFNNPKVISSGDISVDKSENSNNVYFSFKKDPRPVQMFFENTETNSVIGLQLIPKLTLASQTILIEDVTPQTKVLAQVSPTKNQSFIETMQYLQEITAKGGVPTGYSSTEVALSPITKNGFILTVEKKLSSQQNDIWVYKVFNPLKTKIVLQETEFGCEAGICNPDILSVSLYPSPSIEPNQSTTAIVIAKRSLK
jgi:conjugal transfer pilus assembly protein TraK